MPDAKPAKTAQRKRPRIPCPRCGTNVRFCVVSFEAGVYVCESEECMFPVDSALRIEDYIVPHDRGQPRRPFSSDASTAAVAAPALTAAPPAAADAPPPAAGAPPVQDDVLQLMALFDDVE